MFLDNETNTRNRMMTGSESNSEKNSIIESKFIFEQENRNMMVSDLEQQIKTADDKIKKLDELIDLYSKTFSIRLDKISKNSFRITFPLFNDHFVELCMDDRGMLSKLNSNQKSSIFNGTG